MSFRLLPSSVRFAVRPHYDENLTHVDSGAAVGVTVSPRAIRLSQRLSATPLPHPKPHHFTGLSRHKGSPVGTRLIGMGVDDVRRSAMFLEPGGLELYTEPVIKVRKAMDVIPGLVSTKCFPVDISQIAPRGYASVSPD